MFDLYYRVRFSNKNLGDIILLLRATLSLLLCQNAPECSVFQGGEIVGRGLWRQTMNGIVLISRSPGGGGPVRH